MQSRRAYRRSVARCWRKRDSDLLAAKAGAVAQANDGEEATVSSDVLWSATAREFADKRLQLFVDCEVAPALADHFRDSFAGHIRVTAEAPYDPTDSSRHLYVTAHVDGCVSEVMAALDRFNENNRFEHRDEACWLLTITAQPSRL